VSSILHRLHECLTRRGDTVEAPLIKACLDLALARTEGAGARLRASAGAKPHKLTAGSRSAALMAAFNAIALMSTNPWSSRPSIFVI
jgi:hypothetical protein